MNVGKMKTLSPTILSQIQMVAQKRSVAKIILFGSRARGNHRERSDIDLAVFGGDFVRFAEDVEEEVETLLIFDLVDMEMPITPEFYAEIMRDGVTIYEKV